ncbi:tRNA (5-methylaminomethyl-2-thiouridine)(34)-methyltransferase MnmD [Frigidibacter sp. ROC022]|uniref:tRNA (5-methylaminomethyl-2-thiouridine)(34)-methyltransferase MnmD n=1 Tax=Frigidibacter sp. ROC022 TaxID=2971796 RepID=UPI00215A66A2|nr:tRNA (5-methylaminomethyl-2-thiouridine)(34)-methyltransferase MnmD [Frigidibacter sp. ROC022]MCR8726505.1 tRNA (5-methylaminomethyl-2-thiouridine)(34)-methyltransferase MnmD [Frigidibacter sp. ROC022]
MNQSSKGATAEPPGEAIDWRDGGVPVSRRFDDPYFSLDDGLAETGHVFLQGNDLPQRFRDGFHIAELGFGTGLNLLATLALWDASEAPGRLCYSSFEAFPLAPADLAEALAHFPDFDRWAAPLLAAWTQGKQRFDLGPAQVEIIPGDARASLPAWTGRADAWYLDGFSPAKNPELWQDDLLAEVAAHTAPGGSFATYTAAGHVRRALEAAGFDVARVPGYGRKRHMSRGRLRATDKAAKGAR